MLQEEVTYATEEVERLTKVLDEQNSLLQASQEQTAQKDAVIHSLQQKVNVSFRQNRPVILKFRFNVFLSQCLFCTRSNNNMMLLKKQSEMEV